MKKEKKSTNRFTILIILLTIVALILVSGTYARYTSSTTGNDVATVASWDINVNGKDIEVVDATRSFGLFATINDTLDGNDETDVADTMVAPGTEGSFTLQINNASDVTAEYTLSLTESGTTLPIVYSLDKTAAITDWEGDLSALDLDGADDSADNDIAAGTTETVTVYWQWPFNGDGSADTSDTAIGLAAQTESNVTITTTLTVTQVD